MKKNTMVRVKKDEYKQLMYLKISCEKGSVSDVIKMLLEKYLTEDKIDK